MTSYKRCDRLLNCEADFIKSFYPIYYNVIPYLLGLNAGKMKKAISERKTGSIAKRVEVWNLNFRANSKKHVCLPNLSEWYVSATVYGSRNTTRWLIPEYLHLRHQRRQSSILYTHRNDTPRAENPKLKAHTSHILQISAGVYHSVQGVFLPTACVWW